MISMSDLDISTLRDVGSSEFKLAMRGESGYGQFQQGYIINSTGDYRLIYFASSGNFKLQNGTSIQGGTGYLIAQTVTDKPYLVGLAFYSEPGNYSDISNSTKEAVIGSYNSTVGGVVVETTETVERVASINDQGETVQEQRAREKLEGSEDFEPHWMYSGDGKEWAATYADHLRLDALGYIHKSVAIYSEELIREFSETLSASVGSRTSMYNEAFQIELIKITKGTTQNPIVEFRVDEINAGSTIDSTKYKSQTFFETQEEAETMFDDLVEQLKTDFQVRADADNVATLAAEFTTEEIVEVEVFFKEIDTTLETYIMNDGTLERPLRMLRTGNNSEGGDLEGQNRQEGLRSGSYGDAADFSNGGNTLNLDDFDLPRFTTEGYTENKSAAVAFSISKWWRASFELEIDDGASFINDAADGNDGVTVDGNTFDFTMYGGDRLEIDIDNEYDGFHPFFITAKGRTWTSVEEIDDEVSLTLMKAERVFYKASKITRETYVQSGDIKSEVIEEESEGPLESLNSVPLSDRPWWHYEATVKAASNPDMVESAKYKRNLSIPNVATEDSFTSAEEAIIEPVTETIGEAAEAVGDAVGGIWDSIKWWVIGGVAVLAVVIIGAVYVNARAKRPAPAPVTAASE